MTSLDGFGAFNRAELSAAGALIAYLELTQKGNLPALQPFARIAPRTFMGIDSATRRNLELTETLSGERKGSLLSVIDRTVTAAGARELAARLAAPLTDVAAVGSRHDAVAFFKEEPDLRRTLRDDLRRAPDIARALARLSVGRGGPRDLANLRDGIKAARALRDKLKLDDPLKPSAGEAHSASSALIEGVAQVSRLTDQLEQLLVAEPPFFARDGGFITAGVHAPLDEVRRLRDESRRVIASLEARYRSDSGVTQLRIKHNGVLGYFIEVTPQHADKLRSGVNRDLFRHRQTIGSAVRFSTDELATLASRIAQAAEQALAIERELFDKMSGAALENASALGAIAGALAVMMWRPLSPNSQPLRATRARSSTTRLPFTLNAAAIRWWKPHSPGITPIPSCPMTAILASQMSWSPAAASGCGWPPHGSPPRCRSMSKSPGS